MKPEAIAVSDYSANTEIEGVASHTFYRIEARRMVNCSESEAQVVVFNAPTPADQSTLIERYGIDEHTLHSSLDPDELSRLEFEDGQIAIIFKRPKSFCADDNFLLKMTSTGMFFVNGRLVIVMADDVPAFEGRVPFAVETIQDVALRLLYQSIMHFDGHLKAISMLSESLERRISISMETTYLLNMFALEKSLVYIVNSISSNRALLARMRNGVNKLGFNEDQADILDDITIENNQCLRRAEIYTEVIAGLMDARASLVGHNLNQLIKKFTIWTIAIMLMNLVVGIFSMNVKLPFQAEETLIPFYCILVLCTGCAGLLFWLWRVNKW